MTTQLFMGECINLKLPKNNYCQHRLKKTDLIGIKAEEGQ